MFLLRKVAVIGFDHLEAGGVQGGTTYDGSSIFILVDRSYFDTSNAMSLKNLRMSKESAK